jgi:hypothetical protein
MPLRLRSARFKPSEFAPWEHLKLKGMPIHGIAQRRMERDHDENHSNHIFNNIHVHGFWLHCPRCNVIKDVSKQTLHHAHKTCSIRCNSCKHKFTSNKWHCICNRPWIACPRCRPAGFACRAPPRCKRSRPVNHTEPSAPPWLMRTHKRVKRLPPS